MLYCHIMDLSVKTRMIRFLHFILVVMVAHLLVLSAEQQRYWTMAGCVLFGSILTSIWFSSKR